MPEKPKVTVLICALNEEDSLHQVIPRIPDWVDEIILVDGNSTDGTVEVARELIPQIKVLYQSGNGKGDALNCGIENSRGDIIVTLDADGATNPEDVQRFIRPLLDGYDFAKGSRFLQGFPRNKPWHRIIGNWIITLASDAMFFSKYTDLCSGYNAFYKAAIEKVKPWPSDGYENEPLINCRMKKRRIKVIEVAHTDGGRLKGEIKELSWRQGIKAIKTIIRERFCD